MDEREWWTDSLGQLDGELAGIRGQLEQRDLTRAQKDVRALCERRTRSNDSNQAKNMLDEPGKLLIPGWKTAAPSDWVFISLSSSNLLTKKQAEGLYDVFGYLVEFLKEGATASNESEIAPNATKAIVRYLKGRGHRVDNTVRSIEAGPAWNRDTGELTVNGKLAKRIQNIRQATNVGPILDAFQEENWPLRIDDPLPGGRDAQRLKAAIDSLNNGLTGIRFSRDGTGEGIRWAPAE